jgi:hypothetical protein
MTTKAKRFAVALLTAGLLAKGVGFAAEDQLNERLQEEGTAQQEDKAKELKRRQDLENLRRQRDQSTPKRARQDQTAAPRAFTNRET